MYRDYENTRELKLQLVEKQRYFDELTLAGVFDGGENFDLMLSLSDDIDELRERINFAIQDMEF